MDVYGGTTAKQLADFTKLFRQANGSAGPHSTCLAFVIFGCGSKDDVAPVHYLPSVHPARKGGSLVSRSSLFEGPL